jgi:O-acetyl-ADP-ribose deacetylase (regulator of RNase III)
MYQQRFKHGILQLIQGDITQLNVDAIVNAANNQLSGGGGVDGAIHLAAGPLLSEECRRIREAQGGCPTGEAVITSGGNLKARYVIHTVGPIWKGGEEGEARLLENSYKNSLKLAQKHNINTIAFPSISTGTYGYPVEKAAPIAIKTLTEHLNNHQKPDKIILVLHTQETYNTYLTALKNRQH